jgi:phosphoribosylaminoimidazolecarboxamide formyltransferase/IMP cyclohydrolase
VSWPRAALFSLSDKRGAAEFARALAARGTRILASGGTARQLAEAGVDVTPIEKWTGFSEMLGGRVKTLHPHIHAPILARRSEPGDLAALAERELEPIDLVAVTLYPFEDKADSLDEAGAVEEIDIGGVALLRAAAKNFRDVIVAHDPGQYRDVLDALTSGADTLERRREWARATFARTARYDSAIAAELARRAAHGAAPEAATPERVGLALERVRTLRYGENPHQVAALYARAGHAERLQAWKEGRQLSHNNLLDLSAAVTLAGRFAAPTCVIVKHHEPCGAASAESVGEAYRRAFGSDPLSAFGGIVAFNRPLDGAAATEVTRQFVECVAAPDLTPEALDAFATKKNVRLVKLSASDLESPEPWTLRLEGPWGLLQSRMSAATPPWRVVTERAPSPEERAGLEFAWAIAAAARSNAVALARGATLVGLGSGQTSRIDALDVAVMKARRAGHALAGAVLASDGFFPFADSIDHAAEVGLTAVVQPGGSVRDAEVIEACNRHGLAMVFTDYRTFRH